MRQKSNTNAAEQNEAVTAMNIRTKLTTGLALTIAGTCVALAATTAPAPADKPVTPTPDAMFAAWDSDHNKTLTIDEFKAGWGRVAQTAVLQRLKVQFDLHDRNHDNALDTAEFATLNLVKQAGASAPSATTFDVDKNGGLDFKEYVAAVAAMSQRPAPSKK